MDILSKRAPGHVYIIWIREFVRLRENTFKVGRTSRDFIKRLNEYPNGSIPIITASVSNNIQMEHYIIDSFKKKFHHMTEYGNEYFNINKSVKGESVNESNNREIMINLFERTVSSIDITSKITHYRDPEFSYFDKNNIYIDINDYHQMNSRIYPTRSKNINIQEQTEIQSLLANIETRYKTEYQKLYNDINNIKTLLSHAKKDKQD